MTLQDRTIIEYIDLHNCCDKEHGGLHLASENFYYLQQTYPTQQIILWLRKNNANQGQTYCNIGSVIWQPYRERFMAQIR